MNRIKLLRRNAGMTQHDLCLKMDISQTTLSFWENGKFDPDATDLVKLCDILHCSADYLLELTDNLIPLETVDNLYMNLARSAQDMQLPPEDIELILDFAKRIKQKNDAVQDKLDQSGVE